MRINLSITFLFVTSLLAAQDFKPKWANISYAGDTVRGHLLDIYLPADGKGPYRVIFVVEGSAWFRNNTKDDTRIAANILKAGGYAVVNLNHRSSLQAKFPAQVNDIKGAIRFIRANASKYQLDASFIGIVGDSSGGHLAAFIGTSGGVAKFSSGSKEVMLEGNIGGNTRQSSRVDVVVDWYGPTNFLKMDSCGSTFEHNAPDSPESTLIGGPIQDNVPMCILANPMTYIDKTDPPMLVIHGDDDPLVPYCESIFLTNALTKGGVKNEFITIPGGDHGGEMVWTKEYVDRMMAFINEAAAKKKR